MAKPYREVLERYDRARAFGEKRSLPEYAAHLNDIYQTDEFSEGLRDGPWTRFSTRADQMLGSSVGQITAPLGEAFGGVFGQPEAGRRVGEGLPRALLQTAPLYLLGPEAGVPATALALGATGAMFGGQTYADTGSAKAAVLSGATAAAMPAVGKYGGQFAAQAFGAPRIAGESVAQAGKYLNQVIPVTSAQRTAQFTGSQLAQSVAQEASGYAQHKTLSPDTPYDWLSADFLIGQIPFTVYDAVTMSKAPKLTEAQAQGLVKPKVQAPAPEQFKRKTEPTPEESLTSEAAFAAYRAVAQDASVPAEEKQKALAAALASVYAPETVKQVKEVQKAAAESVPELEVTFTGTAEKQPNGNWKLLVESHDAPEGTIRMPDHQNVFINGTEPTIDPTTGKATFKVVLKAGVVDPRVTFPIKPKVQLDPNVNPDLPVQQNSGDLPKRPGIGGSELPTYPYPELESQPIDTTPQITETEGAALVAMGVPETRIPRLVNTLPKSGESGNLVLDMFQGRIQEDAQGNIVRLGNTDVGGEGWMNETRFLKTTALPKDLVPAFREAYPEAFRGNEVNATLLVKGLKERPMVEVKKLEGQSSSRFQKKLELEHHMDTLNPQWRELYQREPYTSDNEALNRLHNEWAQVTSDLDPLVGPTDGERGNDPRYSFLGPKSEQDMPGYVEGLVRVPRGRISMDEMRKKYPTFDDQRLKDIAEGDLAPAKYTGPHFGSEDTNVLAFFRGYEETLPDGRKAFHVIEVQSDWGQEVRRAKEQGDSYFGNKPESHPLLSSYETLALKAAVEHARSVNADAIILSDAETVMMMEGHDKQSIRQWRLVPKDGNEERRPSTDWFSQKQSVDDALESGSYEGMRIEERQSPIPQDAGMRLHYDTTLPSAMKKLTGEGGERVEVGVHKGAERLDNRAANVQVTDTLETRQKLAEAGFVVNKNGDITKEGEKESYYGNFADGKLTDATEVISRLFGDNPPVGSPVFRNPDGTPKSSITGRLFSLDKISGGLSLDDTLSLKEAVMKYEQAKVREEAARAKASKVPETAEEWVEVTGDNALPKVEAEVAKGATATQAAETSRLLTQTPEVEAALKELEVLAEEGRNIAEKAKTVAEDTQGNEQHKYGPALKDAVGGRREFRNEADAQRFIDNYDGLDKGNLRVRSSGRGSYYIAPIENLKTSFDMPRAEEGTGLENVLSQDTFREANSGGQANTTLPRIAVDGMLDTMERLESSPGTLNRMLRENGLTPEEWAQVKEAWTQDDYDGTEVSHMKAANLLLSVQRKPAPYTLGSSIPFDETLVEATGVRRGGRAVTDWLASQPDLGLTAQLVSRWKSFTSELDSIEFVVEGDPRWTPQFSFQNGDMINLSWLPEGSTRVEWAREVAHEMAHFMERKLSSRNDPAAVEYRKTRAEILETLRKSKQLPPRVRALLDKIIKNDDYNRYRAGEDVFGEWKKALGNDLFRQYYDILYGLSDSTGYEMVANAFGTTKMQGFMANERVPMKVGAFKSVLNWFSDIYNKLVGGDAGSSNALAELLVSHDNYLTGGLLRNVYNGKDFIRDSLIRVQGVRPEALASRMQTVERTYAKGDLYGSIAGFVREGENGLLPVTAQYMQLDQPLRTALVSGDTKSVFQGTMSLLPEQLPVHQELFYRMQQDVALTKDLVKQVKEGKIQATLPANTEANLKLASVKLNAMRRALKKQGLALERQADLANFTYEGLDSTIADQLLRPSLPDPESQPPEMEQAQALMGMKRMAAPRTVGEVKTETSGKELAGEGLGFLERTFALTQFFKKEHPEVRPLVGHVQDEHGKAIQTATELNFVLNARNGKLDPEVRKSLERVAGSPALTSAFSDAVRLTAEKVKAGATWSWTDPEFAAILRPLNPQDRLAVQTMQTQFKMRHDHFVNSVVPEKFSELNHENTATVIATLEPGILPDQARELSAKVYDALQAMSDPMKLPLGTAMLQDVQTRLSPDTFIKALSHANESIRDVNGFLEVARKNLDFVSEQRFDKHHLRMTGPKGEKHYSSAPDAKTLQARREDLERKGWKFDYYTPKSDANSTAGGVNPEIMGKFREMDTLAITRLTSALSGRPDSAQLLETVLPEIRRAEEYQASTQAFRPVPGVTRNLVAGREYINMIDNAHEFYGRGINWFKHKITRAKTNLDMMHPEIAGNRVLKDWSEQHVKNYLTQDSSVVRKFNEAVFYQRLALNTGNMALEMFQSLQTGMQALIAETGSVRDAYKLMGSAMKEWGQFLKTKKGTTPDIDWMLRKAEAVGASEPTLWDDTYDPNTNSLMAAARAPGHPVKKGLNIMGAFARKPSSFLQKMNNNIALIAAFKLGMEQGMTRDEAFNFARDVKERGTFTGGKPQRSVGLWSIKSRPVPQLMTSLTTYVQGWFNQMAQDYKIGFRGAGGSDLTAQQRAGSRKAFVYGLAAQAVLAGALGLPGVGQGIALLNQATGLDLKGWLRQNLAKLFDEDEDNGGLLTNLALRGAAQAVSPIDPSNRAAIAVPFVGVDPYKGFSIAALAGAPGSSVEDLVKGIFALAQGDMVGYQKMLPSVLKGPAQLAQGEGDVRDSRGGLLQTLSPAERWMTGLGLPSSRIQRARDTADSLKKQQAQAQREKEKMVDEMARLVRKGDTIAVQRRMLELKQADPNLDLKALARSIATRVQAQTIPYDIRRDMNVGADIAGLQSRSPSTESLRRQVSYDVESSLGFAPSFNPQADAQARAVDALLDSNPFLTRAEALRAVKGTKPTRRRFDPAWTQAFQ